MFWLSRQNEIICLYHWLILEKVNLFKLFNLTLTLLSMRTLLNLRLSIVLSYTLKRLGEMPISIKKCQFVNISSFLYLCLINSKGGWCLKSGSNGFQIILRTPRKAGHFTLKWAFLAEKSSFWPIKSFAAFLHILDAFATKRMWLLAARLTFIMKIKQESTLISQTIKNKMTQIRQLIMNLL